MRIEQLYNVFIKKQFVTTDSRSVEKGAIFFALKGDNFDGNKYAHLAIENGCSFAVVDNSDFVECDQYILVDNVLKVLQDLANYHRKQLNIPIIAITGTNGKTTTKELIASVLTKKYKINCTQGNLNNHIGVPLTLLSMREETEIGVVEMGANHMFEIKELCEIAEPDYGIITNVGKAHLEGFGSFENIIKTKSELYDSIKLKGGKVFYNGSNTILESAVKERKLEAISYGNESDVVYGKVNGSEQFLSINIKIGDYNSVVKTQLVGKYNLENVLAAACIGSYFNVEPTQIVQAIEDYVPKNNRSQFIKTKNNNLYLDAYNANPTSVDASLKNFSSFKSEKACAILGDMLELGEDAISEHEKIIGLLEEMSLEKVILVGNIYNSINRTNDFISFGTTDELIIWLKENQIVDSNVLIKGSRGIQLERIVEYL